MPHSVPLVLLRAGTSWFGWFGFNAGSALSAGPVAGYALVNTQLGACTAMLAWMGIEWWRRRKPSGTGIAAGAVAGLAAITPASSYVQPRAAIIIGAAAGLLCYGAVHLKDVFHYDDSLDVAGVHIVGRAIGPAAQAWLGGIPCTNVLFSIVKETGPGCCWWRVTLHEYEFRGCCGA